MEQVKMGALFLNDVAQNNPKMPTYYGDIPKYDGTATITIAEAPKNCSDALITWNVVHNMEEWSRTGTLLIADRTILVDVAWDDLAAAGFVDGVEVVLKGKKYRCHLLPVGEDPDSRNALDAALNQTTESNKIWHWESIFFWGCNTTTQKLYSATRGYFSARFWNWNVSSSRYANLGFRPALEPLEPDNSFDGAAAAKQNTAEKQKIRVIIRDGIVESVLSVGAATAPDVEIVAIDKDYEDCRELNEYADKLYADPKCKEVDFKLVRFGNGKEPL